MKINRRFVHHAWSIFEPLKWRLLLVVVVIGLVQGLQLVGPYIQGMIIDYVREGKTLEDILWLIAIAGGVRLFSHWCLQFPREWFEIEKLDFDIDERASDHTMGHVLDLSVGQHNNMHSGLKQSVINRGQSSLKTLVEIMVYELTPTISRLLIMVTAMCYLSFPLGVIVLCTMVIYIGLTLWMNSKFGDNLRTLEKKWNKESKFRNEILQHVSHVLVNAQEKKAREEADKQYEETVAFAKPIWKRFIIFSYLRSSVVILGSIAVMSTGAYFISNGRYTLGTMVVFWSWSNNALDSMWGIGVMQRQLMRLWTSIKHYVEFLDVENDIKVVSNPVRLDEMQGRIELRGVSFAYDNRAYISKDRDENESVAPEKSERLALNDVSLIVQPGETVAIVGHSGSGKSTLASLLVRASDPSDGQILFDGQDLRLLDLHQFRSQVGVVEQTVPLFDRSIRDNILYGMNGHAQEVTDERMQEIAELSQISRFSHKLEKGFDTLIGERGIKLSGGERQRVGIARAIAKDPKILILDEATSSLDAEVEAEIREAIMSASKGRTTIIIAHRFSTIRYANRIIVMDEGKIVGEGTHPHLYETCAQYKRLVDHQVTTI